MVKWLKEKDILLRLLAVVFAIFMWLFVIDKENPDYSDRYRNIPLQIEGIEHLSRENLIIVDGGDATASAKLTGKRDRMKLVSNDKLLAVVDASSITEPGVYTLNYTIRIDVPDVTVTTKSPQQITIEVVRFTSASVPVEVELVGTPAAGLSYKNYTVTPNVITVRGPEDAVKTIRSAKIKYNLNETESSVNTKLSYELLDHNGSKVDNKLITVDTPTIEFRVPMTMKKQVALTVGYYSSDMVSEDLVRATMSVSTLMLQGDPDVMRDLNQIQVGSISLRNMVETGKREYSFFFMLPNGVSYAEDQQSVSRVDVTMDVPGYGTKEIVVDSENFVSTPSFSYPNQDLTFRVFGSVAALEHLTAADFEYTPSYSASALKPGKQTILMRIDAKDPAVKVIGTYAVQIQSPNR